MKKNNLIAPAFCALFFGGVAIANYEPTVTMRGEVLEANANVDVMTFDTSKKTKNIEANDILISSSEATPVLEKVADLSQKYTSMDSYVYVASDSSLYSDDSAESDVLSTLTYGEYVHCVGYDKYAINGFYKVDINGTIGYIQVSNTTEDILFKAEDKTVYAKENIAVYRTKDCNEQINSVDQFKSIHVSSSNYQIGIYEVKLSDGSVGYVKFDDVSTEMLFDATTKTMYAKSNIGAFETYSDASNTINNFSTYDEVNVIGLSENWAKVQVGDSVAYVKSSELQESIPKAMTAVKFAYSMLGVPYVWGGTSTRGTDCSGLTLQCYAAAGIGLPRTAAQQNGCGTKVSLSDIQPGDLITWSNSGYGVEHVGIYVGGGNMIHASSGRGQVMVSNVSQYASHTQLVSVVRVTND